MARDKGNSDGVTEAKKTPFDDMHDYFLLHGFYRTSDLNQLLGDPRKHTELEAPNTDPCNYLVNT